MKVGELVRSSSRHAWRCWDGFLLVFIRGGFGLGGSTAAAFHRGGDSKATLPATGAPDDGTLLGEVHGQAWAKVGQSGWGLFCELRWALHWYKPIHLESTGTDPEIQASFLRKPFWLISALPLWKRKVVQEMKNDWWDSWRKGYGGIGSHLCHSWDILSSENEQRPILCVWGGVEGHICIWLFFNANLVKTIDRWMGKLLDAYYCIWDYAFSKSHKLLPIILIVELLSLIWQWDHIK